MNPPVSNPLPSNPTVLLVEDDPTTRSYLEALLSGLPAAVAAAASMSDALRQADAASFDLLLVDARLPDGSGIELLAALRARGVRVPALAHTAAREPDELDPLLAAGFAEVLLKPVDPVAWKAAIARHLGTGPGTGETSPRIAEAGLGEPPVWDDAIAARALAGNLEHVASLRQLFLAELPGQLLALRDGDASALEQLHRLRASCALVGAARLDAAVRALQASPDDARDDGGLALRRLLDAGQATLDQAPSVSVAP